MRAPGSPQRRLIDLVVRDYKDATAAFTTGLDAQAAVVTSWWCDPGLGERRFTARRVGALTCRRDVDDAVHDCGLRVCDASDVIVLVVTGHGRRGTSARHYLTLPDTDPRRLLATAYPTAELVTAALSSPATHVLVIVNCCHAGQLRGELDTLLKDLPADRHQLTTLAVFTTADFDELPGVADLAELLRRVEHRVRTTAGYAREHLSFDDFRRELAYAAAADPGAPLLEPLLVWPPRLCGEPSPCLPNPGYEPGDDVVAPARRQAATSGAELDYWLDRASGRVSAADPGWYFAGRRALTTAVARFLREGTGMLVVTGAAGTGKSAVIARAVTLSDPDFLANPRYSAAVAAAPDETLPPVGAIDVAVLARNKDAADVATDVLEALGEQPVPAAGGQSAAQARSAQLREVLAREGRRRTLVVDGLDEARSPGLLVIDLLGPLARLVDERGRRLVRWVVGVRSATPGTPDAGRDHGLVDLLERAAVSVEVTTLRTDEPDAAVDVVAYLAALLAGGASPYADDPGSASQAAAVVAAVVAPSFLDARLAGQRLREATRQQDLDDPGWRRSLAEGTVGMLRQDLTDVAVDTPGLLASEVLAVLRAAAFAPGAGIPWAEIWPTVTAAVLGRDLPDADGAIGAVLGSRLSGYLTRDVEDGRVVYRPAHDLLTDALCRDPHLFLGDAR